MMIIIREKNDEVEVEVNDDNDDGDDELEVMLKSYDERDWMV